MNMRDNFFLVMLLLVALSACSEFNGDSQAQYEKILRKLASIKSSSDQVDRLILAADAIGRADLLVEQYPRSSAARSISSGEKVFAELSLDEFKGDVLSSRLLSDDPTIKNCIQKLLITYQNDFWDLSDITECFLSSGRTNQALLILSLEQERLRDFGPSPEIKFMGSIDVVNKYIELQKYDMAERLLEQLLDNDLNIDHILIPSLYARMGKVSEAKNLLDGLRKEEKSSELDVSRTCRIASDYLTIGCTNEAVDLLELSAVTIRDSTKHWQNIAITPNSLGRASEVSARFLDLRKTNEAVVVLDYSLDKISNIKRCDWAVYELIALAASYDKCGEKEKKQEALNKAMDLSKGNKDLVRLVSGIEFE